MLSYFGLQTYVLRVHMNCQGCMNKVRKVLSKIKGVYTVEINAEQQTVSVTGNHNGTRDVERVMINQHLAEPLFMDHVNNITNQGFSRVNENPTSESMNFQQYNTYHSHLGSQEWAWNHLAASPIGVHDQQLFPIANSYHPSKAIQQCYHNHLPYEINFY
ncbi:hypothetical protein Ahy_B03g063032 [Arachis hypogaea]|uniref:HMA domain-containing protein n=1 Tax=Arachis hypogaea TaxID=3818 RepID=A0A444ZW04_ARAHY|nr:hypothetical protein Ahy_B03g063032 [Arachis hypogaea]